MKKLLNLYLKGNDFAVSIVRNIYQSLFVISVYNGIANRSKIDNVAIYIISILLFVVAIYISSFLTRSIKLNIAKSSSSLDLLPQLVEKEISNKRKYLLISTIWLISILLIFFSTNDGSENKPLNQIQLREIKSISYKCDSLFLVLSKETNSNFKLQDKTLNELKNVIIELQSEIINLQENLKRPNKYIEVNKEKGDF